MQTTSSPFSPLKKSRLDNQVPMTAQRSEYKENAQNVLTNSLWLSHKMIKDGCTLIQTLRVMEERCKSCDIITPMRCVNQCDTWDVKRELKELNKIILKDNHERKLINALKNKKRLKILNIIRKRPISLNKIQKEFKKFGFSYSKDTISEYIKPLLEVGLLKKIKDKFELTLYGIQVNDAVLKYNFEGELPNNSLGYEEKILKVLLNGPKTRNDLKNIILAKSLPRILKRLNERKLIIDNSTSNRVLYLRTKRPIYMEKLTATQRKICEAIPSTGISARVLSSTVGINLRRTYKYLRNLRGKKLVFRRNIPMYYLLTEKGKNIAEFLKQNILFSKEET